MKEIQPYRTVQSASRVLDSGGRFYNLWAKAGDQVIDAGELARAAGVYSAGADAFLYLEMALADLPAEQAEKVLALLSSDLRKKRDAVRPTVLRPSLVESTGSSGRSAIVTGYPSFVEDRTELRGFVIMVTPVIAMIPIMDQFDVYEVYDTPQRTEPRTVVATARGSIRLDGVHTRFGGTLKELHFEDKTGKDHGLYLEAAYYTPLE
jgi:hypothetical protein